MPRVTEFSVIFDEDVLDWIPKRFLRKYPNESGVFLFGEFWQSRFNIPYITQGSEPSDQQGDTNHLYFSHAEVLRQIKLAAADGRILLGWSHSHPHQYPYIDINAQSIIDARTQIQYRFTVSLIVSMYYMNGEFCWFPTCWKEGFAAPLDILVRLNNKKLITFKQWYFRKYKNRPWRLTH